MSTPSKPSLYTYTDSKGQLRHFDQMPRGAYAPAGYQGDKPGNLYIMREGALIPLCEPNGKHINVGADKAGLTYYDGVWTN